ncbi:DEAD/DEAH box helicase [Acutalibacter sp. 1XD8-36]|uniref:DEAD/DEAH box helicase n=1 Tax=Acutalibacter sp. 1XD8-36 TaxID=2320852 RepID=UPI0014124AE3|nr:DEAD/DEAH box helicase [Acutalibacter sp. 1XD8-36]NBJ87904.1 DEAD/DEAH box helicase [Acutalibacter sp. 1XD8-36]
MGCGKTLTAIAVAGTGYKLGHLKRVLIVAPTSVCAVWPKEFQEYADFPYTVRTLLGTKAQRLKELDDLEKWPFPALQVAVINYESTWREGIFERLQTFDADLIICDESQRIKTHDATQSKAIHKLGDQARYKLILSGTPVQNDAMDIFSQYRFLDPTIFGQNYYTFRNRYAVMGGFNKKQVVGYRDMDELIRKEHSIAYRVTKEEAVDLPEQTFENRIVALGKKERGIYNQLKRDSVAQLEGGGQVTATTVLTRLLRLQQFTGGFLVEDEATKPQLVSRGKLDALADILHDYVLEGRKKLVIFARFIPEVMEIIKLTGDMLGKAGKQCVSIYGDIPKEQRGEIVRQFQTDLDTMAFVGQIDTAGTGITLTAADTCVYYSVNFNYATYSQSLSRIHRIGQKNRCTYIHLVTEKTVDETILKALARKEDLAKTVVDDWRRLFD